MIERTLVLLKPDAVNRGLMGEIISRFERKGLKISAMRMLQVDDKLANEHYESLKDKPFFPSLVEFITSCPVVAMVLEGPSTVSVVRTIMGPTFGLDAPGGTIRGDFGISKQFNLVHGSDSPESAEREISLYFKPEDIMSYDVITREWTWAEEDI